MSSARMVATPKKGLKNQAAWLPTSNVSASQLPTTTAPRPPLSCAFCIRPRVWRQSAVRPLTAISTTLKPRKSGYSCSPASVGRAWLSERKSPTGESEASITEVSAKSAKVSACTSAKASRAPAKLATR